MNTTLYQHEKERAAEIKTVLSKSPNQFYRFFKGDVINQLLQTIQKHETIAIPLAITYRDELYISGRYKFNGKYYLIT